MPYKFEQGYNAWEATKNICCAKGEGAVEYNCGGSYTFA